MRNCARCGNALILEKGPAYLPSFEYRCNECQIGTHAEYGLLWSEEDAGNAWNSYQPDNDVAGFVRMDNSFYTGG